MDIDRKTEILRRAIELIVNEGYGSLSMRGLARASGMKLGALQYHFRTWDALLVALVDYIDAEITVAFEAHVGSTSDATVKDTLSFFLDNSDTFFSDMLWVQLWAMEQVEPLISDLIEEVYAKYVDYLEAKITASGAINPHEEALMLMSMVEGESLFMGEGRRWEKDRLAVQQTILSFVEERYDRPK